MSLYGHRSYYTSMSRVATLSAAPDALEGREGVRATSRIFDPRTCLLAYLSAAIWVGTTANALLMAGWAAGLFTLWLMIRGRTRTAGIGALSLLLWLTVAGAITIAFYLFFGPSGSGSQFALWGLRFSADSLTLGVTMAMRLVSLVFLSLSLLALVAPLDLAAGLTRLALPLRRMKVPVTNIFYLTFFLAQMIPSLIQESRLIRMAQRSRSNPSRSSLVSRWRSYPSLVVPVFLTALRRSDSMSMLLASRGFDPAQVPARVRLLRFSSSDLLLLSIWIVGWVIWIYRRVA